VQDFINLNRGLSVDLSTVDHDVLIESRLFILKILEDFTTSMNPLCIQLPLDMCLLMDLWGYGPGACSSGHASHPVEKHLAQWDVTSAALELTMKLRRGHPYLSLNDRLVGDTLPFLCVGSRLSTVRKNEEKFRTICMEPIGNMALQLAAGRYFEGALRRIGLDIRSQQPRNKAMACVGSIDGSIATIDLSNASDMFTPELVAALLPKEWYDLLMNIRSKHTELPDGSIEELNMISTMGNGFTFPLMTMIIVSLIYGRRKCYGKQRNMYVDWSQTCVFGDDIIIPVKEYGPVTELLESVGLVVNHDKSFNEGPFRESCGGDYFEGYDVTPFYIKSLRSNADVYVAINQVLEWCASHDIWLNATLDLLLGFIVGRPFFVPEWSSHTEGVRTTMVTRRYKILRPNQPKRLLWNSAQLLPLVVGGYITSCRDNLYYLPRQFKTRYRVVNSKLPNGYLTGRSPIDRSEILSRRIDLFLLMRGLGS